MSIENYGYVILVAVIGMAIVFAFLAVLSLLMSVIRAVFGREPRAPETPSNPSPAPETAAAETFAPETAAAADKAPTWVLAAAVAFVELEKVRLRPDPLPWVCSRSRRTET